MPETDRLIVDYSQELDVKAGFVLADPNWQHDNFGAKKHGAARAHYETADHVDIGSIPVERYVDKNSILALCAVFPKLPEAFRVAEQWGFGDYVTGIPWIKTSPNSKQLAPEHEWGPIVSAVNTGIGFWFQSTAELLLFFRRGKPRSPDGNATKKRKPVKGLLCGTEGVLFAPVRGHSAKPLSLYEWAEKKLKGPYLELYARNDIYGWSCVGKETGWWMSEKGIHRATFEVIEEPPAPPTLPALPPPEAMHGACDGFGGSDYPDIPVNWDFVFGDKS